MSKNENKEAYNDKRNNNNEIIEKYISEHLDNKNKISNSELEPDLNKNEEESEDEFEKAERVYRENKGEKDRENDIGIDEQNKQNEEQIEGEKSINGYDTIGENTNENINENNKERSNEKRKKEKREAKVFYNSLDYKKNKKDQNFQKVQEFKPLINKHPESLYYKNICDESPKRNRNFKKQLSPLNKNKSISQSNKKEKNIKKVKTKGEKQSNQTSSQTRNFNIKRTKGYFITCNNNNDNDSHNKRKNLVNSSSNIYNLYCSNNDDIYKKHGLKTEVNNNRGAIIYRSINNNKSHKSHNSLKKEDLINSLNDPDNPFSPNWINHVLKATYNLSIHYKKFSQGVPCLRVKKVNNIKYNLPIINLGKIKNSQKSTNCSYSNFFRKSNKS